MHMASSRAGEQVGVRILRYGLGFAAATVLIFGVLQTNPSVQAFKREMVASYYELYPEVQLTASH